VHLLTFVPYLCPLNASFIVDQFVMKCFFCISYLDLLSAGAPMTFNILKGKILALTQLIKHIVLCDALSRCWFMFCK